MGRAQELLDAAREGDKKTVEKIVGQINKRSGPFTSLRRTPGVNVHDDNGYTPLHHACLNGHKNAVEILLSADASPCIVDKKGATPLHLAAFNGCPDVVRMLLAHNAPPVNLDQLTLMHETALMIAAQFGHVEVVRQLIRRDADVTIRNKKGESALDLAAQYGRLATVKLLIQLKPELIDMYRMPIREGTIFPSTPLHRASKYGRKEVVEALLAAGIDPNIRTENGTPLHEAACFARASVVRLLLEKGADIKAKGKKGKTVHELLAERPEDETRNVREAIKDFLSHRNSYDSEEDCPPFPVYGWLQSPTALATTPETQKMSNKNESLLSTSSLTNKNHPQSFVKKLASKCLGLKAKFNSAPNISNNSDTEADVSDKKKVQISNSNTLHTGNSKFFNMFSKREESGEIICTNEFDTISLDRHETLNRDSVVNRSNRSCPGFKTSLPNISENNELSDHDSVAGSMVNIESSCDRHDEVKKINEAVNTHLDIFEPRERASVISNTSVTSAILVNEYYESFEFRDKNTARQSESLPRPLPRPNVHKESMIYENVSILKIKPTPAARTHIPTKPTLDESENKVLYENIVPRQKPDPPKRSFLPPKSQSESFDKSSSPSISRSSTLSSDSMIDESNLEDILLSKKSKSFRQGKITSYYSGSYKSDICRTQSNASDSSDITEISAIDNVDCSDDLVDPKSIYLSMTGTLPNKKTNTEEKKILFRHKTFTNIEVDRNSVKVRDLPQWNREFLKETLPNYHIRGTGHCIYSAPTVEEFIYVFNRDTLYKDVPPFTKVPNDKHDSYFETAICFCKPRPPKHHNSAEDLLERIHQDDSEKVSIDIEALKNRREICQTSFICFCDSGTCKFHSNRRETSNDLVVKFSAINKSMSTPDITLEYSPSSTTSKSHLTKINSVPYFEEPYAVVSIEDSLKKCEPDKVNDEQIYTPMSRPSTMSSTSSNRLYSLKDISDVISINDHTSAASTLTNDVHLPVRKSSSSEYSGQWSLQSCNSNVTIKSDLSYKTCLEESSDDSDGTLHSDDESEAETIKSDISTAKRPWVHSDSFRFGSNANIDIDTIAEENSFDDSKYESMSSKFESGISVEGSESSSSGGEDDSGIPRGEGVSLDCASLERGSVAGGVRSGSGRRRWDEIEGTSEGDALSVSSAASSCAPLHFAHHHEYSKVSPTPPKKPPRRNLSVSPTHANSPSSGYSYELRVHARSQDDLDDIQGTNKHYLKHGRSVDHYVDSKLSYSEYEENHNSPRVIPIPNPRTSLKQRSQPVAINATYENVVIKEQNPRRKLKRNSFAPSENYERMNERRKYTHQERSSLESLLDDQSVNSPSDCERYYDGPRSDIPLSPTHYEQPPTPDHPPPSAKQAEKSIHERIRPLSQLIMEVVEEIRIRKKSQGDVIKS